MPSSSSRKITYDVFLSFRGEDTRTSFTDHLYTALKHKGIFTFRDDEQLERGESIAPSLFKAIEESRYVVVVFSRHYADSSWCLDEIAKVADCMKQQMGIKVMPVFYDVDPSEVRSQKGDYFKEAFEKHSKIYPDKVQRWRDALSVVGNLSGWHLQNGSEAKVIQEVVQKIFTELIQVISTSGGLVGMDSHLEKLLSCLDIGSQNVRIIGICGMGGIGKSTIAEVVYEKIRPHFEGCCFLKNVREVTEKEGVDHLQEKLLSKLLNTDVDIEYTKMGKDIIMNRLSQKKVLIVLDDVNEEEQLDALCDRKWFGPGSRIIITSRDANMLSPVEGDEVYKVDKLSDAQGFQLFCMKCLKKDQPVGEEMVKLAKEFVKYADGLPLAIKVLGSSVKGRNVELWPSMLGRLKENPQGKITNVLKVSFDGLEPREKQIFLDIACFFKGEKLDRVRRILQGSSACCPDFDIKVLVDKDMVTLFGGYLGMHDLIQELGREIFLQECPQEPGNRSRLWNPDEIIHVIEKSKGTSAVQGILLQRPTEDDVVHSVNDSFSNMNRLRLLRIYNIKFSGDIKYLSNDLQFLDWHECPLSSLPPDFQPRSLVELHMHSSRIERLWRGGKEWGMLRWMDLRGSQYLISTPDFTEVPELEVLVLLDCTSLVEIHPSLGFLRKLSYLNMRNCKSVKSIPPFTSMDSLEVLDLLRCSELSKFPKINGNMKCLSTINLGETSIERLPPSVEQLTGVTYLNLKDCKKLVQLPSTIQCLTSLKVLILAGCSNLDVIPDNLSCVKCLEELDIDGTAIKGLSFLVGMKNLRHLFCEGCTGLHDAHTSLLSPATLSSLSCLVLLDLSYCDLMDGAIPNDLSSLISLTRLYLGGNYFLQLPDSISQLPKLQTLNLDNCRHLELLPKLPPSCRDVHARGCTSLKDFPNQFNFLTSVDSGVTLVNSLDSSSGTSALGSSTPYKGWSLSPASQGNCGVHFGIREDEHSEWEQVDEMSVSLGTLLKDIEVFDDLSNPSCFVLGDNEIPEMFNTITTNTYISIPISPNLIEDNNWKGVAACAVFSLQGVTDLSFVEPDSVNTSYIYQCTLETDVYSKLGPYSVPSDMFGPLSSSSHILLVNYLDRSEFGMWLNHSNVMMARFETNNPCMEVLKCGIHLLYEKDAGWFKKLVPGSFCICLNDVQDAALKPGWISQVDKCLKWEKFIPPCEEDHTILQRRNIESVLPRYLAALEHNSATCIFNIRESPAWFELFERIDKVRENKRPGPSVSIKLPPNLYKSKKWMGFAIYATVAVEQCHTIQEYDCVDFQLKMGESCINLSRKLNYIMSEEHRLQLLLVYVPRAGMLEAFTETAPTVLEIFFTTNSPAVEVQRSGVRIVYQENFQEFVETIIQCVQREDTIELYDKLVVEQWLQLIRLQGHRLEGIHSPKERDSWARREREFELLSQKYRNWDWSDPSPFLACVFYGAEITKWKWFTHFVPDNSSEIHLPPNVFDDSNWLGIAVCAFYWASPESPSIISDTTTPDSEFIVLDCCLDTGVDSGGLRDCKIQQVVKKLKPWEFASYFTSFFYVPRARHLKFWRQCNQARVTFLSSSPCLELLSCALRLVFKKDVDDLVQTLTLCELS